MHFPNLLEILKNSRKFNCNQNYREKILAKVTKNIKKNSSENNLQIQSFDYQDFEKNSSSIRERINQASTHFDENKFPGFIEILLSDINIEKDSLTDDENENSRKKLRRSFDDEILR